MGALTEEEKKRILAELEQAQAEREAIPPAERIPITNPDKYAFPIGIPDEVILCPYCLGIIEEKVRHCPHCGRDITRDAPVEMTLGEYQTAERIRCPFCGTDKLKLAKICPSCGK
jgi:hypothetical protein